MWTTWCMTSRFARLQDFVRFAFSASSSGNKSHVQGSFQPFRIKSDGNVGWVVTWRCFWIITLVFGWTWYFWAYLRRERREKAGVNRKIESWLLGHDNLGGIKEGISRVDGKTRRERRVNGCDSETGLSASRRAEPRKQSRRRWWTGGQRCLRCQWWSRGDGWCPGWAGSRSSGCRVERHSAQAVSWIDTFPIRSKNDDVVLFEMFE